MACGCTLQNKGREIPHDERSGWMEVEHVDKWKYWCSQWFVISQS